MRKMPRLISFGFNGALQPWDSVIKAVQLDQIRADIVVGISKFWINIDGRATLRYGLVQLALEMVSPAEKCVSFGGGMQFQGGFVKIYSTVVIALHLGLISILQKFPRTH